MKRTVVWQVVWQVQRITVLGLCLGMTGSGCRLLEKFRKQPPTVLASRDIVPAPYLAPTEASPPDAGAWAPEALPIAPVLTPPVMPEPPVVQPLEPITRIVEPKPIEIEPLPKVRTEALTYTVKKGDSLWKISRAYGVSIAELASENNLNPKDILPLGKVLRLPPGAKFIPESERPKVKPQVNKGTRSPGGGSSSRKITKKPIPASGVHVVQRGDNLWLISMTYGVPVATLKAINGLTSDRLMPKQKIRLVGNAAAPKSAPPTAVVKPSNPDVTTMRPTALDVAINVVPEAVEAGSPAVGTGGNAGQSTGGMPAKVKRLPHFVVDGDTLKAIAEMYGSKVEWIVAENPDVKSDADLRPGKKITVPVEDFD